jgi:iron complex transport system ATP-binding protein
MTLQVERLAVRYGARLVLEPTSFSVPPGELVGLIGPNGAGKSTLMKALAGLVPHSGETLWQGRALAALGARARARAVAYLPQAATVHWPMKVRDLIELGRLPHRAFGAPLGPADCAAVEWALRATQVSDLAERSVAELSIGERARVLLARALAVGAPLLLVDEPIAMLDPFHQLQIMQMLHAYTRPGTGPDAAAPRLAIAVLHDLSLAGRFCDRVLLLDSGRLAGHGPPEAVLVPQSLREHYRVEPWTPAEGKPPIVPWRTLD